MGYKWVEEVKPLFSADESALVAAIELRSLLVYAHKTIPLAIVAGGYQPKDVANRDEKIAVTHDEIAHLTTQEAIT